MAQFALIGLGGGVDVAALDGGIEATCSEFIEVEAGGASEALTRLFAFFAVGRARL